MTLRPVLGRAVRDNREEPAIGEIVQKRRSLAPDHDRRADQQQKMIVSCAKYRDERWSGCGRFIGRGSWTSISLETAQSRCHPLGEVHGVTVKGKSHSLIETFSSVSGPDRRAAGQRKTSKKWESVFGRDMRSKIARWPFTHRPRGSVAARPAHRLSAG